MKFILWLPIFFIAACTSAPKPAAPKVLVVRTGKLIDGRSNHVWDRQDILIRNGVIVAVGTNLPIAHDTPVLDWRAYTVLPGLIDMHTHLTADPADNADLKGHMLASRAAILKRARLNAQSMLEQGFTTVRDLGTYHAGSNIQLRDEIERGETPGPRIQAAPFYLTTPGGGGDIVIPDYEGKVPAHIRRGVTKGPEGFAEKAKISAREGDLVKVIASGAILAFNSEPGAPEMTPAELEAAALQAHKVGKRLAVHAHGARSIKEALEAGADTIEHASLIDEEGLQLAKKKNVALAMDIYNGEAIDREGRKMGWPEEFLRKNRETTEKQRENFARAVKAGVPLVYATDAGVYPYGENARQFKIMVSRGMKPMAAIQSATSSAALYMGWAGKVGEVTPGAFADLIAVEGDPLKDISRLESIQGVLKGGESVKRLK